MSNYKDTVARFNGLGDVYDKYRPVPPKEIKETLINCLGRKPHTIVDLGCGTGLSTFIWKDFANQIIGIDPNQDTLDIAIKKKQCNLMCDHVLF